MGAGVGRGGEDGICVLEARAQGRAGDSAEKDVKNMEGKEERRRGGGSSPDSGRTGRITVPACLIHLACLKPP